MSQYAIVSIVGSHAGADLQSIVDVKQRDIIAHKFCYWVLMSHKAKPDVIRFICSGGPVKCYFIHAAGTSKARPMGNARPTTTRDIASMRSVDKLKWEPMPAGMSEVTGRLGAKGNGYGLVLGNIEVHLPGTVLDIAKFSESMDENEPRPLGILPGCSTICCVEKDEPQFPIKSRSLFATGTLVYPFCVWLRKQIEL